MPLVHSGSRRHHIQPMGPDWYRLSWTVDYKHRRILYPRRYSRDTDRKGAERFAKRWGCAVPWEGVSA